LFADIAHDGAPLPVPTPAFFAARFFTARFFTIGILVAGFLAAASARSLPAATITAAAITAATITAAAITAAAITAAAITAATVTAATVTAATVTAATVITVPVPAAFGPFATTGKSFAATTGRAAFPTLSPTARVPPAGLVAPPSRTTLATRALASLERSAALILPATPLEVAPLTLSTLTLSTLTLSALNWPTLNWPTLNWPALNWPALASLGLQFMKGQQPDHRDQQPDSALVSILASIPHVSYPLFCPGKKRHGRHPILTVF